MKITNIGIVGLGRVASRFAAAIKQTDSMRLWSVCVRDYAQASSFLDESYNGLPVKIYTDYQQFLIDDSLQEMNINWAYRFIDEAKWRTNSSLTKWWCLSALGTHCIDIAMWYLIPLCGDVQQVKIVSSNSNYHSNDESIVIAMKFANGATVSISCSILFNANLSLNIFTSKGVIQGHELTGDKNQNRIHLNGRDISFDCNNNLYQDELLNLLNSINTNSIPEVTLLDGYKNICYMHGMTASK